MRPVVSIKRCKDYDRETVRAALKDAISSIGEISDLVRPGERILIKPNILSGKPPDKAVTTHPELLRAVIEMVVNAGAVALVGDSSAIGSTTKNAKKAGLFALCDELGAEFVELKTIVNTEIPGARVYRRLTVAREALDIDGIINLPKLKTHVQMYLTMGIKNLFGCVPGKNKAALHMAAGRDTDNFASMLLDLHTLLTPRLTIMDAVMAMEGNGPGNGDPKFIGLLLASNNAIAIDRVSAEILSTRAENIPVLKIAREWGLTGAHLKDIELRGEAIESVRVNDFKFPPLIDLDFSKLLPNFIGKRVKKALTTRPIINTEKCARCNACVSLCPAEAMELKNRIIVDYEECIRCYCCQESCPSGVITAKEGWLKKLIPGM